MEWHLLTLFKQQTLLFEVSNVKNEHFYTINTYFCMFNSCIIILKFFYACAALLLRWIFVFDFLCKREFLNLGRKNVILVFFCLYFNFFFDLKVSILKLLQQLIWLTILADRLLIAIYVFNLESIDHLVWPLLSV